MTQMQGFARFGVFLSQAINRFNGGVISNPGVSKVDNPILWVIVAIRQLIEAVNGSKKERAVKDVDIAALLID